MKKTHSLKNADFIKYRPETEFVADDEGIFIITATGYKLLRSKWIKKIHNKLYPILLSGCSKSLLLNQSDEISRTVITSYLDALSKSNAIIQEQPQVSAFHNTSLNGEVLDRPFPEFVFENTGTFFITENLQTNGILAICFPKNIFNLLNDFTELKQQQISIIILPSDLKPNYSFTHIPGWYLQTTPSVFGKSFGIKFFEWDDKTFSCRLLLQKKSLKELTFSDLSELGFIRPDFKVSQLPVSVISPNINLYAGAEKTVAVNYQTTEKNLLGRAIISQINFAEYTSVSTKKIKHLSLTVKQTESKFTNEVETALSKFEVKAKVLDKTAAKLFTSTVENTQINVLDIVSKNTGIIYLQTVLKQKISSLAAKREVFKGVFFSFSDEVFFTVSISEEKALYDFLLSSVYSLFYPPLKTQNVLIHSNILSFVNMKTLKNLIEIGEKELSKTFGKNFVKTGKTSTFLGDFYWGKLVSENESLIFTIVSPQ
jgi:hypothetical protein